MTTLEPERFRLEDTTVWSFPDRGVWVSHNPSYRGNWAPQVPRNLILRYSKPGDLVLDQMCGSGTTLIECKLTGRNAIGYDINPRSIELCKKNLNFTSDVKETSIQIHNGDARDLYNLSNNTVDLIATHPPYIDIIKYSNGEIYGDLSNINNIDNFCKEINAVASECFRVLKPSKYCGILIGDTRRRKYYIPLAYKVMQEFLNAGFKLKEDIIKCQWNCKSTPYWRTKITQYNFLLIMHEHLFVFEKPDG
ncbi:MAG: methyltransferase domain-containing protein [Nitrospirae bacterium]|nr:methyltransferase domain-containing protein [Nitrospirota bacterium]